MNTLVCYIVKALVLFAEISEASWTADVSSQMMSQSAFLNVFERENKGHQ